MTKRRADIRLAAALAIGFSLCATFALASPKKDTEAPPLPGLDQILPELRQGGFVIYLRHAATDHGSDDVDIDFKHCETQRNLSVAGKQQARDIGIAFKQLGIPVGTVLSSPFCRARETAELAFGRHQVDWDLYFAIGVGPDERARLGRALRDLLSAPPVEGTNTVIVAHTANLKEAADIWPKPEGAAYIFHPGLAGQFSLMVPKVLPDQWRELARAVAQE